MGSGREYFHIMMCKLPERVIMISHWLYVRLGRVEGLEGMDDARPTSHASIPKQLGLAGIIQITPDSVLV
jgi:hypothetical protein